MGLSLRSAAQYIPPTPPKTNPYWYEWTGAAGDGLWGDYGSDGYLPPANNNWWHANPTRDKHTPPISADLMFGGRAPDAPQTITVTGGGSGSWGNAVHFESLWFDANAGRDYTLVGANSDTSFHIVGWDLPDDGHLITVLGNTAPWQPAARQAHINIEVPIELALNIGGRYRRIENYSLGGLRLGGALLLGNQHLKIGGTGATHIAGNLSSLTNTSTFHAGNIHLTNPVPIAGAAAPPTQLILSGDNSAWTGGLYLDSPQTMAIFRNPLAMRPAGPQMLRAQNGSSFVLRGGGTYGADRVIHLGGLGAVRQAQAAWGIGALYYDGGGETTYNGAIQLGAHTRVGARGDAGGLTLSGQISGNYWFSKVGPGLVTLTNSGNNWSGSTEIWAGVLRITNDTAIPNRIHLKGGILELAYGTTTHNFALNKVQWGEQFGLYPDGGGFSAYGGNRTVTIAGGATLTWGQGGMVGDGSRLLLSSRYADSVITLTNPINLGNSNREIRVERGSPNARAVLSGALTGTGGIIKTGPGLLHLTANNNTYTGPTRIREGAVLRSNVPISSNIRLEGGVLGLDANFTANLGTGAGKIQWLGSGGFAAYGGDRHVTLNGGATLTYGETPYFSRNNRDLAFGHYTATGTVIWNNPMKLSMRQTIHVERGRTPNIPDVVFNQQINGDRDYLIITGNGRVDLNYSLSTLRLYIYGVELRFTLQGEQNTSDLIAIHNGGTLTIDNTTTYISNRIDDTTNISLNSGDIRYLGRTGSGNSQEIVGNISIIDNTANTIENITGAGGFTELIGSTLIRAGYSTINYITNTEDFSKVRLSFTNWDNWGSDAVSWITVNGKDWGVGIANNGVTEVRPYSNYKTGTETTWAISHNVHATTPQTLSDTRTIRTLKLADTTLNLGAHSLKIANAGLLTYEGAPVITGSSASTLGKYITNGHLYIHIYSPKLTIAGGVSLDSYKFLKTGPGTLILNSNAIHTLNFTYIHQGIVDLQQGGIKAIAIRVGDGSGRDILILPPNRTDPLLNPPRITLRGTPYGLDPSNVYGGEASDQAILRFGGNTKQRIDTLSIENRGTIDFAGGAVGLANILWVKEFYFRETNARLFIRNWYEYEDYLLLKRSSLDAMPQWRRAQLLSQIIFDGYQDYKTSYRHYDNDYWEITPFDSQAYDAPEPTTYGAIVGALGVGLWAWRRRKQREKAQPALPSTSPIRA